MRARVERELTRNRGITIDYFGFAAGRCVITLSVAHEPGKPRVHDERRLLRLLYGRATKHPLSGMNAGIGSVGGAPQA